MTIYFNIYLLVFSIFVFIYNTWINCVFCCLKWNLLWFFFYISLRRVTPLTICIIKRILISITFLQCFLNNMVDAAVGRLCVLKGISTQCCQTFLAWNLSQYILHQLWHLFRFLNYKPPKIQMLLLLNCINFNISCLRSLDLPWY